MKKPGDANGKNVPGHLRTAARIERLLSEAAELQKTSVSGTCSKCVLPCCTRVHYLFCEKDILFFKLSGRRHRWRREGPAERGCRFLGSGGCVLEPKSRPFICHRYLCPELEKAIIEQDPGCFAALTGRLTAIDELRSRMWAEYLDERMQSSGPGNHIFAPGVLR